VAAFNFLFQADISASPDNSAASLQMDSDASAVPTERPQGRRDWCLFGEIDPDNELKSR
jgi:hypothetical protein